MGCDGGTIPRRDELVKTKKKPEQRDKDADRLYRWKNCAVSQSELRLPIVACELGRLYSKEEIITRLLAKSNEPNMSHIKGTKDIKELVLSLNPCYKDTPRGEDYFDTQTSEYVCPITSQEMNGKSKFFFIWTCGCVVSERALKEIKSNLCHVCNRHFDELDVIQLNPSEEETEVLRKRMEERRAKRKKSKSKKHSKEEQNSTNAKRLKSEPVSSSSKSELPDPSAASSSSSFSSAVLRSKEFQKVRSCDFSVAKDSSKSEIFKSIFDSHKSAENKPSGHWVTCNPQYF